jgi:hypothetical protein
MRSCNILSCVRDRKSHIRISEQEKYVRNFSGSIADGTKLGAPGRSLLAGVGSDTDEDEPAECEGPGSV